LTVYYKPFSAKSRGTGHRPYALARTGRASKLADMTDNLSDFRGTEHKLEVDYYREM